jgi:hypothetical protein
MCLPTFFHPDYTVGPGLSPDLLATGRTRGLGNHLLTAIPPIGNCLTV